MRLVCGSVWLALIAALPGCARELTDASCPCVAEYQCCVARNVCLKVGAFCAEGTAGASGEADAGAAGDASPQRSQPLLITSGLNDYWREDRALTEVSSGVPDVTVNDTQVAQTWHGFGGAFNELGWKYLLMLNKTDRTDAIERLFGSDGLRFNMGRIPIGASDYARERYTLAEIPSEIADDFELSRFTIDRDMINLIPYVQAALAVRPDIRFWASPWTPPTWLKEGPFEANPTTGMPSPFDGGTLKSDAATLQTYAQYFVKFVQQYAEQGITIDTIAPQNEPTNDENYPSCRWNAATYTTFIGQHLGPALKLANLDTHIMLGTLSNASNDGAMLNAVLADPTAASYINVIGMQWDMLNGMTAARASGLPRWQTEHKAGNCPAAFNDPRCRSITAKSSATPAPNDHAYAIESWHNIHDWITLGVSSYSAWNMVLDRIGLGIVSHGGWNQNALLTVDAPNKKLAVTPVYYVFRHLSRYVEPGAQFIAPVGGSALAFKNPSGELVTVMFNAGEAKTSIVSLGGRMFSLLMPATGWATIILP